MILTVTANVAIDRTYVVERLEVGAVHKVKRAYAHTGGKGVNVSRCVQRLGGATLATGMVGREGREEAARDLSAAGIESSLFPIDGPPRQTVTVTAEDGSTTAFDEPGPTVSAQTWTDFTTHLAGLLERAQMLVIAGSLPPGSPDDALLNLCRQANSHRVPVILDARGAAMRAAQEQAPLVAKLNRAELELTFGRSITSDDQVLAAAVELQRAGARHVLVTLGERGAIALADDVWRVTHPTAAGNPIGAGDAFSAALALALSAERPFEQAVREGAAAALASLSAPTAGALDVAHFRAALPSIELERIVGAVAR